MLFNKALSLCFLSVAVVKIVRGGKTCDDSSTDCVNCLNLKGPSCTFITIQNRNKTTNSKCVEIIPFGTNETYLAHRSPALCPPNASLAAEDSSECNKFKNKCTECMKQTKLKCEFYKFNNGTTACVDPSKPPPDITFDDLKSYHADHLSCPQAPTRDDSPKDQTTPSPDSNNSPPKLSNNATSTPAMTASTANDAETNATNPKGTTGKNSTVPNDMNASTSGLKNITGEHPDGTDHTEDKGGFHAGSFIGGIIAVIIICCISYVGFKYFKARRDGRPYTFSLFGGQRGLGSHPDGDSSSANNFPF